MDPINRQGVLRLEDRDRMIEFSLLPSAPLFYRGAPAALGDFPPGTMVEIWAYGDPTTQLPRNVLRMSDDFSVKSFSDLAYRVDKVDLQKRMFTATLVPLPRSSPSPYIAVLTAGGKVSSTPSDDRTNKIEFSFNDQTA